MANPVALQYYHKMVPWTIHIELVDYFHKDIQYHMVLPTQLKEVFLQIPHIVCMVDL